MQLRIRGRDNWACCWGRSIAVILNLMCNGFFLAQVIIKLHNSCVRGELYEMLSIGGYYLSKGICRGTQELR